MEGIHLDLRTAVITAFTTIVFMPLLIMIFRITAKHIKEWARLAVDGTFYWLSRYVIHRLAAQVSLKKYCKLVLASTRFVPVPSTRDITLSLDDIFVKLNLENAGLSQRIATHADVFSTGNRFRIIGDPGSGKSCLTKRLLRDAAQQGLKKPAASRLPILFELRNLNVPNNISEDASGEWFYHALRKQVESVNVLRMGDCVDSYAAGSGLLVLLDGLDEIASREYKAAESAICQLSTFLSTRGENNIVVLTSRTQFHQQVRLAYADAFPSVFFLKSFTPTDIYEFLNRWPFQTNRRSRINQIFKDLTDRPTLRELCGNPLILSMYVAESDGPSDQLVPDSRTEFYSRVCDELLINRRVRQTGEQAGRTALRIVREELIGSLAFDHLMDATQPANSLGWKSAIHAIMTRHPNYTPETAEIFLHELAKETGLFTTERPGETYRFMHLTLCEFFAAAWAVRHRENGWRELLLQQRLFQNLNGGEGRARLIEVIPFACGLLHSIDRKEALSAIRSLGDNRLLARCFLETKLYTHQAWPEFIAEQRAALISMDGLWSDDWLFDFHLFNVVSLDAEIASSRAGLSVAHVDFDTFLQDFVTTHDDGLAKLINAYAEKDAAAVFRVAEVAGIDLVSEYPQIVIDSCDQKPFLELLLERLPESPPVIQRWSAVLAEAALRSPVVTNDLKNRPSEAIWQRILGGSIPKRFRWRFQSPMNDSFLSQCIEIATFNAANEFALIRLLTAVPAPGSSRILCSRVLRFVMLLVMVAAMCVMVATQLRVRLFVVGIPSLWFFLAVYLFSLPAYMLLLSSVAVTRTYRLLLDPEAAPVDRRSALTWFFPTITPLVPRRLRNASREFMAARADYTRTDKSEAVAPSLGH